MAKEPFVSGFEKPWSRLLLLIRSILGLGTLSTGGTRSESQDFCNSFAQGAYLSISDHSWAVT